MDTVGNINHSVSVFVNWIFGSNYNRYLILMKESLDQIFAPTEYYTNMYAKFRQFYHSVWYVNQKSKFKRGEFK